MTFDHSDDIPFNLKGGEDPHTAAVNRTTAINRINYIIRQKLPDFDIRTKSDVYMKCLDLELWKKYYQEEPKDKRIDEEFCQRVAEVCIDMEKAVESVLDEVQFKEAIEIAKVPERVNKENWISKFWKKK